MKVGLIPGWMGPSSGTAMATWSLLPLSIPLLIFSGNISASKERSWGTWAKGGGNVRQREVKEPPFPLAGRVTLL